jgi:signal transduction histidine kinase
MEHSGVDDWKADILLVDDEQKNLLAIEALLEPLEQNLLRARSGEEALRIVLEHDLAVVILDVRMPGMDGFETARMIRSRERSRYTPIIFLTGVSAEMDSALHGYEVGAVDYLVKPPVPGVLRSKVSVFVELHRRKAELTKEIRDRKIAEERASESEAQLRALAARLVSIREEERRRVAREIHDELGQALTGLKLDVTWLAKRLEPNQHPLLKKTESMCCLIDSTVHLVRKISTGLRPEVLDEMGLVEAIRWQAQKFQKRTGIRCRLNVPAEQVVLGTELSITVFRIFQETLTNVARHARASSVDVDLGIAEGRLMLDVEDDGIGIPDNKIRGRESLGLLGMRERAQQFGGELSVRGESGRGTMVSVSIPVSTPDMHEAGSYVRS